MRSVANCSAVATRVRASNQDPASRINCNSMGVPRHLVPSAPAVEEVPSLRQRMHGIIGKASLQVQGVARFPKAEAAGQEPGHFDRLLDIEAMIDHRRIELQLE